MLSTLAGFLLDNGVGQNLTAGAIVFVLGVVWSRTKYWPLHAVHEHLEAIRVSHASLHAKLDAHAKVQGKHALAIEALHQRVSEDGRSARPSKQQKFARLDEGNRG